MKQLRQLAALGPAFLALLGGLSPAAAQPLLTGYWAD
ncbi:hypothetical protein A4X06_0g5072, partial [Tilletia controversa]